MVISVTKERIDQEIGKVKEQMAELKEKYAEQKEALAADFKEKAAVLQAKERELRQKRKMADDMEKQKMTQNLSVEELQALLAKHNAENKAILEKEKESRINEN